MVAYKILEQDLGIEVYFYEQYSPWQISTYENMTVLIRYYLPKGIDLN